MNDTLTIDEMGEKLGIKLTQDYTRVISQSMALLQKAKSFPEPDERIKKFQRADGKWQVYKVKAYDPQLYYDFQQLCIVLGLI